MNAAADATAADDPPAPAYLPARIREVVTELWEATGAVPVVEPLDRRSWRITIANDRVVATVDMRRNASRNIRAYHGTLTVDGIEREPVETVPALADVFLDPPDGPPPVPPGEPIPLPPDQPADQAPPEVATQFLMLQRAIGRLPSVGLDGEPRNAPRLSLGYARGRWVIAWQGTGSRGEYFMRWCWMCDDHGRWRIAYEGTQVLVGGKDITDETGGDIARAIQLALGHRPLTGGPPASPAATPRSAARSNAVETRRATVRRV